MRATLERALVALTLLIAMPAAAATAAFGTGELMQLLASVQSSNARFTETRDSAMLKAPLVQHGTLAYRRPDHLEKHVDGPSDEHTVLDWMAALPIRLVLVAGSYLGSLSHTLTSLDALHHRHIMIKALVTRPAYLSR